MTKANEYWNAAHIRRRYDNVSDMTLWRWQNHPDMDFPQPVYFGRLRFWRSDEILAWEAAQAEKRRLAEREPQDADVDAPIETKITEREPQNGREREATVRRATPSKSVVA